MTRCISLTTDYGLADGFVAACHGVLSRLAPTVRIIDISHLVPPGDIARGSIVLADTVPYLPDAVHMAVVDPGVGTPRRGVAVQAARGVFVGPDNGLLTAAIDVLGGPQHAVELTNAAWFAGTVSPTFHGRDVFAPVAARLALGAELSEAGAPLDPDTLVRLAAPVCTLAEGLIEAEVTSVDQFGNVQLAAPGAALARLGDQLIVGGRPAVKAATFGDVAAGTLIAYVDSAGKVALAINGGHADVVLDVSAGDVLRLAG